MLRGKHYTVLMREKKRNDREEQVGENYCGYVRYMFSEKSGTQLLQVVGRKPRPQPGLRNYLAGGKAKVCQRVCSPVTAVAMKCAYHGGYTVPGAGVVNVYCQKITSERLRLVVMCHQERWTRKKY